MCTANASLRGRGAQGRRCRPCAPRPGTSAGGCHDVFFRPVNKENMFWCEYIILVRICYNIGNIFSLLTKFEKMLRGLSALLLVALLAAPAAGQQVPSDDEFALLGIPRPGAMLAGFGLPPVGGGFSKLLDEITQGDDEVTPNGAENAGGRMTIIGLPHMLSGLFRQSQEQARPTVTMRFRPMFAMPAGPSLSRPLKELSMLANGCEPCSRVQSHMRSMSIMLGPNGQRVETVTEVGGGTAQHCASLQQRAASAAQPFPAALLLRA
jgi:hypothetical protein